MRVQVPNGLAWDTGKRLMFYNDTPGQLFRGFETDAEGIPVRCCLRGLCVQS